MREREKRGEKNAVAIAAATEKSDRRGRSGERGAAAPLAARRRGRGRGLFRSLALPRAERRPTAHGWVPLDELVNTQW